MRRSARLASLLTFALLIAGCDALGIETAAQVNERKEAEGKAIGSACRHAVRSIESCFQANPRAAKAAVFAGWKEMDQYMRDNSIVGMPSEGSAAPPDKPAETPAYQQCDDGSTVKMHEFCPLPPPLSPVRPLRHDGRGRPGRRGADDDAALRPRTPLGPGAVAAAPAAGRR